MRCKHPVDPPAPTANVQRLQRAVQRLFLEIGNAGQLHHGPRNYAYIVALNLGCTFPT